MVPICVGRREVGKLKIKDSVEYGAWITVLVLRLDEKTVGREQSCSQRHR